MPQWATDHPVHSLWPPFMEGLQALHPLLPPVGSTRMTLPWSSSCEHEVLTVGGRRRGLQCEEPWGYCRAADVLSVASCVTLYKLFSVAKPQVSYL